GLAEPVPGSLHRPVLRPKRHHWQELGRIRGQQAAAMGYLEDLRSMATRSADRFRGRLPHPGEDAALLAGPGPEGRRRARSREDKRDQARPGLAARGGPAAPTVADRVPDGRALRPELVRGPPRAADGAFMAGQRGDRA